MSSRKACQSTVLLQWGLFLLEACRRNPRLARENRFSEDDIEKLITTPYKGTYSLT